MKNRDQLIDYLLEIQVSCSLSLDEEKKIVGEIFKNCWDTTPENLYRYRSCTDYNYEALLNDKLILTKPTLFNDPYDSLLFIDKHSILQTLKNGEQDNVDFIGLIKSNIQFREEQEQSLGKELVERFANLKPYKSKIEELVSKQLSIKKILTEAEVFIETSLKSLKQSSLVGCFSEDVSSILMWSHYAQNHKGFALNYDFKSMYYIDVGIPNVVGSHFVDKKLFPVKYSDERYDATAYIDFHMLDAFYKSVDLEYHEPFFDKLFYYKIQLLKSKEWQYEKEWRIIQQTNIDLFDGKPDFHYVENISPKEIFLGANINNADKDILIEISKKKNLPIFQMELDLFSKSYRLIPIEVKS